MLKKDKVINTIAALPESFSLDELVERMIVLDKVEKGLKDSEEDRVISEEELDKQIKEWLK